MVYGMTVRMECYGTIIVPFEEQRPKIGIVSPQQSQLLHALIVAEPTPATGRICVDRGEEVEFLAELPTKRLIPSRQHERENYAGASVSLDADRLVSCDT